MQEQDSTTSDLNKPPTSADTDIKTNRQPPDGQSARRWWIMLIVQPLLLVSCGVLLMVGLGVAQHLGYFTSGGGEHAPHSASNSTSQYICPMMCTPPQTEPGRCPVCAMELVPAASGNGERDSHSIRIDPAARRIANIHTVAVQSMPMSRTIRAVGELTYDEGTLKTISAYVDGRLDRLYADYTGVVVTKGDHLALVYSPELYSGQVELLVARKARDESRSGTLKSVIRSNLNLYRSSRQRLLELGMTAGQIDRLEQKGEANSRMHLCAPISGTVIEKLVVEGEYVKEGQGIYKLADLSTVWLMLKLFPEDAAQIHDGQQVVANVQSLPGREFVGHVAFIAPNVEPDTRTVDVRVVVPNHDGLLRVGDYAKARIDVPITLASEQADVPIQSSADIDEVLVVPRDAVLMAGGNSVLYVETEPGRFEIRRVVLGPACGNQMVILRGVSKAEQVATRGNFLIDSQMQLAGNPSLIDPARALLKEDDAISPEVLAALSELRPEDRAQARKQKVCPVAGYPLGSMGKPEKVDVNGKSVFICCEGCRESLLKEPEKYLARLADGNSAVEAVVPVPDMALPSMGNLELVEPHSGLPPIDDPVEIIEQPAVDSDGSGQPAKRISNRHREVVQ